MATLPTTPSPSATSSGDEDALKHLCQQLFRKELIRPPPTFTREDDIQIHLKKIEEFYRVTNITNDEDKVYVLIESLKEDLQKELKMMSDFQTKQNDYKFVKDTVSKIFKRKAAPITPFLRLLKTTQTRQQSVEDFARDIRIKAFDLIYNLPETDREKYMLECFANGLRNKSLATALKLLKPTTLEEAVKNIKKEEKEMVDEVFDTVHEITCSNECHRKIAELSREVANLKKKIDGMTAVPRPNAYVNTNVQFRRPQRMTGRVVTRTTGPNNKPPLKCHNCNQSGHFANACRLPKRCYNCGRNGHISRFCREKRQVNFLQSGSSDKIEEESVNSSLEAEAEFEEYPTLSVSNKYECLTDECNDITDETEEIYLTDTTTNTKHGPSKVTGKGAVRRPTLLDKQVAFIEGKGPKPKNSEMEMSSPIKENKKFYNKPVVKCRLNGDQVNTLMDSGATCNLLAKEVFDRLSEKHGCHVQKTGNRITCANNSILDCMGEVSLHFSLGGITTLVKFLVVDGLRNCQAILGLRTMKKLRIQFDFQKDSIVVEDIIIPFESHVSPATTVRRVGNEVPLN